MLESTEFRTIESNILDSLRPQIYGPLPNYRLNRPESLSGYLPEERFLFAYHHVLPVSLGMDCKGLYGEERLAFLQGELWLLVAEDAILAARDWSKWTFSALRNNAREYVRDFRGTKRLRDKNGNRETVKNPLATNVNPFHFEKISVEPDHMKDIDLKIVCEEFGRLTILVSTGREYHRELEASVDRLEEALGRLGISEDFLTDELRLARRRHLASA